MQRTFPVARKGEGALHDGVVDAALGHSLHDLVEVLINSSLSSKAGNTVLTHIKIITITYNRYNSTWPPWGETHETKVRTRVAPLHFCRNPRAIRAPLEILK